jgi:hypothetical protein
VAHLVADARVVEAEQLIGLQLEERERAVVPDDDVGGAGTVVRDDEARTGEGSDLRVLSAPGSIGSNPKRERVARTSSSLVMSRLPVRRM